MTAQEDVRDHLSNFMDVVGKLEDMDVKIHTELFSIMMLYSLPTNFDGFRTAIESRDVLPSSDNLKIKIVEEYEARRQTEQRYHFGGTPAEKREDLTPEPETEQIEFPEKRTKLMRTYLFRNLTPFIPALDKILWMNHLSQVHQRDVRPPAWTKDYELSRCETMFTSDNNDDFDCSLLTYKEAVAGTDTRNLEKAMQSEMESLQKNITWIKDDGTYKARLVVRGCEQKGNLDFQDKLSKNIDAYSDSDYPGDPLTRKSTSGSVLMIADGPISWVSKRQPIVASSKAK
ncbi:unnamed protein product [Pieris brassicae]|uniref:Uncharacterized protein n=1 Tax=Pieris brassicae TaxID=7116 RepID=A0A9P0XH83_PIEBR|nr:unnamed protein product [Pieris brassicae]